MQPYAKDVVPILIQDEMRSSYMDYSMSVIIGRALPDVRDGLKPVHRRILYAMRGMGLTHDKKYQKCAGVVGEVLKLYHPHGDSAVYDALVRMAQPWNLRYPLVDGQGNFGSVDGDPAAAYRYTESKMTKLASELLVDIEKETVGFTPNFDGVHLEPEVLPARYPNLLVNGADGIAVGMATKIPPHNLGEIVDAAIGLIDDPDLTVDDLLNMVPGPDFPTAGTIYGRKGVRDAYTTGRGRVVLRGNVFFETLKSGTEAIVIDELPYQVNKSRFMVSIRDLVRDKRIEGISTFRDESDRDGMRIVIELKRDAFPEVVVNHLYKHTALQSTVGVILLAIVNNRPRILTLKEMLQHYLAHRREVVLRRTRFELRKARERAHLLEGFLKALDLIDEVIKLIRASSTVGEAREGLVARFGFTLIQAQAILDMRLQRLTGMERQKLEDEYGELMVRIAALEAILGSEAELMGVVRDELHAVRAEYADERRTRIVDARSELTMHDLVAEEDHIVTLSRRGYIKRCSPDEWRMQRRGGVGKKGMATRDEDFVTSIFVANTHATLLVFTDRGIVFPLNVYDVPETGRNAKGRPIVNLVPMPPGERIASVVSVKDMSQEALSLLFFSRSGLVKRTPLSAFRNLRAGGMRAAGVAEDDELLIVRAVEDASNHAMLFTGDGKCIRFSLDEVPLYGRNARGNLGINLSDGDVVVDGIVVPPGDSLADVDDAADDLAAADAAVGSEVAAADGDAHEAEAEAEAERWETTLLTVTELGYGSRTPFEAYRVQGRNGKGIISFRTGDDTGRVVGAAEVNPEDQLMLVTDTGRVIRFSAGSVTLTISRAVKGVRLMRLEEGERIVDLARLEDAEDEDDDAIASEDGTATEADAEAPTPDEAPPAVFDPVDDDES